MGEDRSGFCPLLFLFARKGFCSIMHKEGFFEVFKPAKVNYDKVVTQSPPVFYPQEKDWTCFLGCIRTILTGITEDIPSEEEFVEKYQLEKKPYFSEDIKNSEMLKDYSVMYGCDDPLVSFDDILLHCREGYYVMLETMYNFSHWFVLLGYYPSHNDVEISRILVYDPYYDEVRLLNLDEFLGMWIDGDFPHTKVEKDYIAIKK
jgi:hypothetical protein